MTDYQLSEKVLQCAFRVHTALGPGLLESAYEMCLCFELTKAGLQFIRQKPLPLVYEGVRLDCGYRIDIEVESRLLVEIKSQESLAPIHQAQTITYLRLSGLLQGLLINFNVLHLKDGIRKYKNRMLS